MSIKIKGTDVIDDDKNIVNVVDITSSNLISAVAYAGDGSALTGVTDLGKSLFIANMISGGDIT
jgi:hypothetical protein